MQRSGAALALCLFGLACSTPFLPGTDWIAQEIEGQGVLADARPTLAFEGEERAGGSAGCNRWFASVEVSGEQLRFSGAGATRMACEPDRMQQETSFLAALEAVRSFRPEGRALRLFDASGAERLRFTRSGVESP